MYPSPNILKVIKSRRMGCEGHVARMEEMINICKIFRVEPEGKRSRGKFRRR
jgi:hypothetical protein